MGSADPPDAAIDLLEKIKVLCEGTGDQHDRDSAARIARACEGGRRGVAAFLVSNELWGGSGSIADQACISTSVSSRREVEALLIQLGRLQMESGRTNVRTEMWVSAFEQWREKGIR